MRTIYCLFGLTTTLHQANAQAPDWAWAARFIGSLNVTTEHIAASKTNGCFVSGWFAPDLYLPFDTLTQDPLGEFFVAHVDSLGAITWALQLEDRIVAMDVPSSGGVNCLIAYTGSTSVNGQSFSATDPGFSYLLIDLEENGSLAGSVNLPGAITGPGATTAPIVRYNADGGFALAGKAVDSIAVLGLWVPGTGSYTARLNSAGQLIWADMVGCGTDLMEGALSISTEGRVSVGFQQSCGTGIVPGDGTIATFDPTGTWLWSAEGVLVPFLSSATCWQPEERLWAGTSYASMNNSGFSFARLSGTGAADWYASASADIPGTQTLRTMRPLAEGGTLISGGITGPVHFSTTTLTTSNGPEGFVAVMDSSGMWVWAQHNSGGVLSGGFEAANGLGERYYVTGGGYLPMVFGPDTVHAEGNGDFFGVVACLKDGSGQALGISDANTLSAPHLALWPDPAMDALFISNWVNGPVVIYDLLGRTRSAEIRIMDAHTIDVSRLPAGHYVLATETARASFIKA